MAKVLEMTSVGQLLTNLTEQHREGNIKGLVVGVLDGDGEGFCDSFWVGLSYLERMGLAENLVLQINRVAVSDTEADNG